MLYKSALLFSVLSLVTACTSSDKNAWEKQEIVTQSPCFDGYRYVLSPVCDSSHIELEVLVTRSGTRLFVNFLLCTAPSLLDDPCRSSVTILIEGQDPWIVYPYLLAGGQRLLFPSDVASALLELISQDVKFVIRVGRDEILVVGNEFLKKKC